MMYGYSQNVHSYLNIRNGASVTFIFNHLTDYQNGLSLPDYTSLGISFTDTTDLGVPAGPGWELTVRAMDAFVNGTTTAEKLDLNVVELIVGGNTYTLTNIAQTIATGPENDGTPVEVLITYDVGKTNKINVAADDEFAVNLMFTLQSQ